MAVVVLAALAVNLAVMVPEIAAVGWLESSFRRLFASRPSRSAVTDMVAFLLVQSSLALVLASVLTVGVVNLFTHGIRGALAPWQMQLVMHPAVYYLLYLLVIDFCNYWAHRFFHQVAFLWEIHKFHHSATEMTVLTATRDHPLERLMGTIFVVLPISLLAPPRDVLALTVIVSAIGPIKHCNAGWSWGWFGKYVVQSPRAHRIHHSIDDRHHNRNYASIFSFWDHMFGTWCADETARPAIGLADNQFNQKGTLSDLASCYQESVRTLFARDLAVDPRAVGLAPPPRPDTHASTTYRSDLPS